MALTIHLFDSNTARECGEKTTLRLGQGVVETTVDAITGQGENPNTGNVSSKDATTILSEMATTGYQNHGEMSTQEEKFRDFLAGPASDKRSHSQIEVNGQAYRVQTTKGKDSGASVVTPGSKPYLATVSAPLLEGVVGRAYSEFGNRPGFSEHGMKFIVKAYNTTIDSPRALEKLIDKVVADEAKSLGYRRPVVYEPARLNATTADFAGKLVVDPNAFLAECPMRLYDGQSTFVGSKTEAAFASAIKNLGGSDWKITNYEVSDGNETSDVGAVVYSRELGLAVRFAFWQRN